MNGPRPEVYTHKLTDEHLGGSAFAPTGDGVYYGDAGALKLGGQYGGNPFFGPCGNIHIKPEALDDP